MLEYARELRRAVFVACDEPLSIAVSGRCGDCYEVSQIIVGIAPLCPLRTKILCIVTDQYNPIQLVICKTNDLLRVIKVSIVHNDRAETIQLVKVESEGVSVFVLDTFDAMENVL